jgi:hypothetical protein
MTIFRSRAFLKNVFVLFIPARASSRVKVGEVLM